MNEYQQEFKYDMWAAVIDMAGYTWKRITGITAVTTIITTMLIIGSTSIIGAIGISSLENYSMQQGLKELLSDFFSSSLSPAIIAAISLGGLVLILISIWGKYISMLIINNQIYDDTLPFADALKKSFDAGFLRMAGMNLLIFTIIVIGLGLSGFIGGVISVFVGILAGIGVMLFLFRFILVIPAFVLGKMTFEQSFAYSFTHITTVRAIKLFGISVLGIIGLFIAAFIIGLITSIFMRIPYIGPIIQTGIQILLGGFISALFLSGVIGLYYRYASDIDDKNEALTIDDLIVSE